MQVIKRLIIGFAGTALLAACGAGGDDQGTEYAPNMYHSVAYEPYTQITDKEAGRWTTSIEYVVDSVETNFANHAEYYNSNSLNPFRMNMRLPAPNTVSRNKKGYLPYRIGKDSLAFAEDLVSPLDTAAAQSKAILADGKVLYEIYCDHCHGAKGEGDGKVATGVTVDGVERSGYGGVANLRGDAIKGISEGHIFHVITMGKGLMQPHGSQISVEDRWKISRYVKALQAAK
ncbi:MAG TPA: cytochrome c [Cyclobacteriaceae bacterium]|nr:cytochrome c [Cyclobacteriaceae bacterium]